MTLEFRRNDSRAKLSIGANPDSITPLYSAKLGISTNPPSNYGHTVADRSKLIGTIKSYIVVANALKCSVDSHCFPAKNLFSTSAT